MANGVDHKDKSFISQSSIDEVEALCRRNEEEYEKRRQNERLEELIEKTASTMTGVWNKQMLQMALRRFLEEYKVLEMSS
jgi:hypothetical protein